METTITKTTAGCRACGARLEQVFLDLGLSPLANSYVEADRMNSGETFFPLRVYTCSQCWLVQLEEFEAPESIFSADYAYFSSFSSTWLEHAKRYVEAMTTRWHLGPTSRVVEIASNDGYLLQYFVRKNVPCLGVEPAVKAADAAQAKGVQSWTKFFGINTAQELVSAGWQADLLLGNNVLAHVPALNEFVAGLKIALKPAGVITMEFPHLLNLMRERQFDTIYHEHFSYFSLLAVAKVFQGAGLRIFDVEQLPTHGGSLRIYACHTENSHLIETERLLALREKEHSAGLDQMSTYLGFKDTVHSVKWDLLRFLLDARKAGKSVVGYGAPAKGNTLLNYCGVRPDLIEYTVDKSPRKQGTFLPGTRIPVYAPERLHETKPDFVLILPWNIREEIMREQVIVRAWGGRFVVPIPELKVFD